MSSSTELRRAIETCELRHLLYVEQYDRLRDRVDDALAGHLPRVEALIGPSRAGKSMILTALARSYPKVRTAGVMSAPVLRAAISSWVSPREFPVEVLEALGIRVPRTIRSVGERFKLLRLQLQLAGTKVLLLEESSHFVEVSSKVQPRAAADMFKTMIDEWGLTLIAFGVPRLERLFSSNEQLRLRASSRRVLYPYDFALPEHSSAFAGCVRTFTDLFEKNGWPIDVKFPVMVKNCYLHSGGLIGLLSKFMQELAARPRGEKPRPLTFEDCQIASEEAEGMKHPAHLPFQKEQVAQVELSQVYGHVFEVNQMSLPKRRPVAASAASEKAA